MKSFKINTKLNLNNQEYKTLIETLEWIIPVDDFKDFKDFENYLYLEVSSEILNKIDLLNIFTEGETLN